MFTYLLCYLLDRGQAMSSRVPYTPLLHVTFHHQPTDLPRLLQLSIFCANCLRSRGKLRSVSCRKPLITLRSTVASDSRFPGHCALLLIRLLLFCPYFAKKASQTGAISHFEAFKKWRRYDVSEGKLARRVV